MSHSLGSSLSTSFGGGERDRTDDPLLAKQVLSQLSYTPGSELRNQESVGLVSCTARCFS
jgi:hypothetical protein